MSQAIRVGIAGLGWPGVAHARGYQSSGGFKIVAVADLIPDRRRRAMHEFGATREYADAADLVRDKEIDAISVCLPNHLHAPTAVAALRAGKHVVCETPPALSAAEARRMDATATKAGKVLLYALQRRFGPGEQAARQAVTKGYAGDPYHARASWLRTRGIPHGTGWYTDKSKSGGGALIDLGAPMLDLAWHLLGQPRPLTACSLTYNRFRDLAPGAPVYDVEDQAFALLKFEGGKSLELAASWAINQAPHQNGTVCRLYGTTGAIEVYTPQGAVMYRNFGPKGEAKETPLRPPKVIHHTALMRHFRECILGKSTPTAGGKEGITLMQMLDALYKSSNTGRTAEINTHSV